MPHICIHGFTSVYRMSPTLESRLLGGNDYTYLSSSPGLENKYLWGKKEGRGERRKVGERGMN